MDGFSLKETLLIPVLVVLVMIFVIVLIALVIGRIFFPGEFSTDTKSGGDIKPV